MPVVWICHVSVRFDSNTPREPPHTLLTAFLRSAQCAGVEERASARESAADIALNFAAGAISRPAMAGTARGGPILRLWTQRSRVGALEF